MLGTDGVVKGAPQWGTGVRQEQAGLRNTEGGVRSAGAPTLFLVSLLPAVFLSFFGIASIGLSCLVALFLYHVVFGVQYLGILNGVAAFVIVGIGELLLLP